MKQNGMYWLFFSPMIKGSIRKRYGRELADRAVKKGRLEYRRLVENAPELGKGNPMASNAYFAYVFVGAWLGTEKELLPDDMALVMTDVLENVRWVFGMKRQKPHDPNAPYDGYDESDDTRENARTTGLKKMLPVKY